MTYMFCMGIQTNEWLTLVEIESFVKKADKFLQVDELDNLKQMLANTPEIGAIIPHSGGIRKVRISAQQKGKSGGARVIYYFHNSKMPLFLLDVYVKSEKIDLTKEELTKFRDLTEHLRKNYGV